MDLRRRLKRSCSEYDPLSIYSVSCSFGLEPEYNENRAYIITIVSHFLYEDARLRRLSFSAVHIHSTSTHPCKNRTRVLLLGKLET